MIISGCLGPESDSYSPETIMTAEQAQQYHATQINTFSDTEADLVTAVTLTYPEEATGIALAAKEAGMPIVISFTVETDGAHPPGRSSATLSTR